MTHQESLWLEDAESALTSVVFALGGWKRAARHVWPSECPITKGDHLRKCLTPERREKLALGEILSILRAGREAGCHTAIAYFCDVAGYKEPEVASTEDERAKLQREFVAAVQRLDYIRARYEATGEAALERITSIGSATRP